MKQLITCKNVGVNASKACWKLKKHVGIFKIYSKAFFPTINDPRKIIENPHLMRNQKSINHAMHTPKTAFLTIKKWLEGGALYLFQFSTSRGSRSSVPGHNVDDVNAVKNSSTHNRVRVLEATKNMHCIKLKGWNWRNFSLLKWWKVFIAWWTDF